MASKAAKKAPAKKAMAKKAPAKKATAGKVVAKKAAAKKAAVKKVAARKAPAKKAAAKKASTRKAAAKRAASAHAKESIFTMNLEEIEKRLASGQVDAEMELYFGSQLPELMELARSARSASAIAVTRGKKPKALVLPGIMGSTLGFKRPLLSMFHDTLWIDPADVVMGRLWMLGIPSPKKIIALDVFPIIYVSMKLELEAAGFDAEYFPFDWRLSLKELGAALKAKLASMGSGKVHLAAHSMGGLVARAALKQGAANIGTVAMMGTPNHGSYAPVLAFRGSHDLASKISGLDLSNNNVELTEKVFSSFTGLAQMLPLGPIANGINWHDAGIWPASPKLRGEVLKEAGAIATLLADAPKDWHLIAGINQETIVRAEPDPGGSGLRYQKSFEGDGTVPLRSAQLPELDGRVYYVEHGHGTLPMNKQVRKAVIQLFQGQSVTALPASKPAIQPAPNTWITDGQLAARSRSVARSRSAASPALTSVGAAAERLREALDTPLADSTDAKALPVAVAPAALELLPEETRQGIPQGFTEPGKLRGYTVSRETQHFLEIELVHGDISQVNAEAIVLCRFQNMDLGRAAQAVDARMGGVLADMMRRRMFSSNVGEMFMLPTGRHPVSAEIVAVTGLGSMDALIKPDGQLSWDTLELVAENTLRTLLGAGVTEFATLLFGNLAKADDRILREGLSRFLRGFVRGLQDSKESRRFRRVLLCEADAGRYQALKKAILDLLPDPHFETVQVRLDESVLPPPEFFDRRSITAASAGDLGRDPAYLFVRTQDDGDTVSFETTFASAGNRAAIPRESKSVSKADLADALDKLTPPSSNGLVSPQMVKTTGKLLADLVLHPRVQQALAHESDNPLIIVHDAEASRIPWETLMLASAVDGGDNGHLELACKPGISRQYAAANLSVAKWMESRREDKDLRVLLIADPTGDLPAAREEGLRISALLKGSKGVVLTELWGEQATRAALLTQFRSGDYDVIHYAGHAFFDPASPMNSGLICAPMTGGSPSVLSGADLARLGQLPMLVFLNACESARVRGRSEEGDKPKKPREALPGGVGVAEALMRGGVANFIGTYWPVGDDAARGFSESLYGSLVKGHPLGRAVTDARNVVKKLHSGDWADYLHYGSPNFMLKKS